MDDGVAYVVLLLALGNVEDNVQDSTYGPWIVVKHKLNGAKNKSSNMGPQARHYAGNVQWSRDGYSRSEPVGPSREIKRKISPTKGLTFSSLSPKLTDNGKKAFKVEKAKGITKPSPQASVKGKKALARSRAATNVVDRRDFSLEVLLANHAPSSTSVPSCAPFNGVSVQGAAAEAQPAITEEAKHDGGDFKERAYRSPCAPDLGLELVHSSEVESMEDDALVNRSKLDEGRCRSNGLDVDGHGHSVVGMSIEGAGCECNPEESFEATRLGLEGGVNDPIGARKPAFKNHVRELVRIHDPAILIVMETRVGGVRAKEIADELPFDRAIHTDTIGYAASPPQGLKTHTLTLSHHSAELTACFAAQMSQTLFPLPLAPSSSRFSSNLSKNSNLLCPHSPIFSNPTFPHPLTFHSKLRISQPTSITPIRSQPMSHSSTNSNSAPIDNPRWSLHGMTALVTGGTREIGHTFKKKVGTSGADGLNTDHLSSN
ncbi:hypothetical protein CFP56_030313 [Quercus suber]|uniref:Uncharacterized protein n=1 Tax=Quercus suber TaxID=58331 RepID=A0AAW0JMY2_QUESU